MNVYLCVCVQREKKITTSNTTNLTTTNYIHHKIKFLFNFQVTKIHICTTTNVKWDAQVCNRNSEVKDAVEEDVLYMRMERT